MLSIIFQNHYEISNSNYEFFLTPFESKTMDAIQNANINTQNLNLYQIRRSGLIHQTLKTFWKWVSRERGSAFPTSFWHPFFFVL